MASTCEQETKYTYRFSLSAKSDVPSTKESTKQLLQDSIEEILGITKGRKLEKPDLTTGLFA